MIMARKRKFPRIGRSTKRVDKELLDELEELARQKVGGNSDNPIAVGSPVQVDSQAESSPCPRCEGSLRLVEHVAETIEGERLRVAHCRCVVCGVARSFFFRLESPLQS